MAFSFKDIKNQLGNFFIFRKNTNIMDSSMGGSQEEKKNLNNSILPVSLNRENKSLTQFRKAIEEAERLPLPFRVEMQKMYNDTINNAHTIACMNKRKNLNLLKQFKLVDKDGNVNEEWTNFFSPGGHKKKWFYNYINDVLDAIFFGYSLISLGDIVNNEFVNLTIVRRWNVSPDRKEVAGTMYAPSGISFIDGDAADWHIYVDTPTDIGSSGCGFGLLYPVSLLTIIISNTLSFNLSFNELFGAPVKVLKSTSTNEEERAREQFYLENLGNGGGVVLKKEDELEFIEANSGSGYTTYANTEERCQKNISKIILGHSDAIDSIPGKLGNSDGSNSSAANSLNEIEKKDLEFLLPYLNVLLDKMRNLGINVPTDLYFIAEDNERQVAIKNEKLNMLKTTSEIFKNIGSEMEINIEVIEDLIGLKLS